MSSAVEQALDHFIESHLQITANQPPQIEFDSQWPSECYQGEPNNDGLIDWQPVRQQQHNDLFERIEQALETTIHPDLKAYYNRYWSDPLAAHYPKGQLNLLFVWNTEDLERLRANLIGHALGRQRLKQPLSFFFGCTVPEEFVLVLDNDSGQVMLEQPGKRKSDLIAPSLAEFLTQLTPLAQQ